MARIRVSRVAEQIKKELNDILRTEFKDPRVGFLTITGVDVTGDLSQARVYLSVMGDEQQKEDTFKALERGKGFLRSELGKRIRLRMVPELLFELDTSIEYGSRIERLIHELHKGEQGNES